MTSRVALVTGGTGGIGTAICRRLALTGHRVATNYRNEEKARAWQAQLRADGIDVVLAPGDVSSPEDAEAMIRAVEAQTGPGRDPRQQRGHHPRHHVPQDERAAMARSHQHQPGFLLQRHAPGDRGHARAQVGPHHPDRVDQRPEGPVRPGQLRRGQGRHARLHHLAGAGEREVRHHRQHGFARATSAPTW